jgi:hypothetical protein
MIVEELDKLTDDELRSKANAAFAAEGTGPLEKPGQLLTAQFYLSELSRREDERLSKTQHRTESKRFWIEFLIEALILGLVGYEAYAAAVAEKEQVKQAGILAAMLDSTNKQTNSLQELTAAQRQAMKAQEEQAKALERQSKMLSNVSNRLTEILASTSVSCSPRKSGHQQDRVSLGRRGGRWRKDEKAQPKQEGDEVLTPLPVPCSYSHGRGRRFASCCTYDPRPHGIATLRTHCL